MKSNKKVIVGGFVVFALVFFGSDSFGDVRVAVIRSWGYVPVFTELNDNWEAYGSVSLTIDTSLLEGSFTYEDLVNTGADVVWLSDPAGGAAQYSTAEIEAVQQYVHEGHSILGTYAVFGWSKVDNRDLAPLFGLPGDAEYNSTTVTVSQTFDILVSHTLFRDVNDPYVSSGYDHAQVPADDLSWDDADLGAAQLLARTDDGRGIITWYETGAYHAIYVSEMVEYHGNTTDTQFLYNALTMSGTGNTAPVACIVDGDRTIEAGIGCEARVTLDGSCSSDLDSTLGTNDDINDFDWYIVDSCDPNYEDVLGSGEIIECNLPLGEHIIILEVTDKAGAFDANEVTINVEDTTPPEFTLSVEPDVLWPANHKMVEITPSWEVSDNCDEWPEVTLVSITMNEDDDGKGDGHTANDIQVNDNEIWLRAERSRRGTGRVYTITYQAVDDSGNVTLASATVTVPPHITW